MIEDLTGQKFNKLTVIERVDDYISPKGEHKPRWRCSCDCGENDDVIVTSNRLKRGDTKSCGCLQKELYGKRNDFEIMDDYAVLYTQQKEPFYVDLDDLSKVQKVYWRKDKDKYLVGCFHGKIIKLHRYIMDCPKGMQVDHIGGEDTRNDNRKKNLRFSTPSQNARNRKKNTRNKSGVTGVSKKKNKWLATICVNGNKIDLGYFQNIEDAIKVRKEAEEKYFGEWSYDNSQQIWKEITNEDNREQLSG